jgi:DegV family protein with EDD domain
MKLGFVTDSTSDIPQYLIEQHELEVIPTILILDGNEYEDGKGISRDDFYKRLPAFQSPPTTAAPSIGDFSTRYESLLTRGCEHVLSIHPAGLLTAIVNVARQAAADFGERVTVIDSRSLSLGLGFQVIAAAESAESGLRSASQWTRPACGGHARRVVIHQAVDRVDRWRSQSNRRSADNTTG